MSIRRLVAVRSVSPCYFVDRSAAADHSQLFRNGRLSRSRLLRHRGCRKKQHSRTTSLPIRHHRLVGAKRCYFNCRRQDVSERVGRDYRSAWLATALARSRRVWSVLISLIQLVYAAGVFSCSSDSTEASVRSNVGKSERKTAEQSRRKGMTATVRSVALSVLADVFFLIFLQCALCTAKNIHTLL